jgi:flagellar hook-basal body complex protein FliE
MTISAISPASLAGFASDAAAPSAGGTAAPGFLDMVDAALRGVSTTQASASAAESSYAVGAPGATLGNAVVASDRAEVDWNATVAVRNEVVSAYQSIMNMQF